MMGNKLASIFPSVLLIVFLLISFQRPAEGTFRTISRAIRNGINQSGNRLRVLPRVQGIIQTNVQFLLYNDANDTDACVELFQGGNESIAISGYDSSKPLKILIHGLLSNYKTPDDINVIKNAYLRNKFPANILVVNYASSGTGGRFSFPILRVLAVKAQSNTIAKKIGEFVKFLISSGALSGPESVHIIGFGYGAHIGGAVGQVLRESFNKPVDRITALDPPPTIPLSRVALDPSDGVYVDVAYTSFGYLNGLRRRGHAQFYFNGGGPFQPNCHRVLPIEPAGCSHHTAVFNYAKTIDKPMGILGCTCTRPMCSYRALNTAECPEPVLFGEYADRSVKGNFFIKYK